MDDTETHSSSSNNALDGRNNTTAMSMTSSAASSNAGDFDQLNGSAFDDVDVNESSNPRQQQHHGDLGIGSDPEFGCGAGGGGGGLSKDDMSSSTIHRPFYRTKWFIAVIALLLVVVVIATAVSVAGGDDGGGSSGSSYKGISGSDDGVGAETPEVEISEEQFENNKVDFGTTLINRYDEKGIDWTVMNDPTTPQHKALIFVTGKESYSTYSDQRNVQRYTLACLYYATYRMPHPFMDADEIIPWTSEINWVSEADECTWEGVQCDSDVKTVVAIRLPKHDLTGTLPMELAFLEDLEELDFTTNFIYMEGSDLDVFKHLSKTNFQELLMDDNYIVTNTGVPTQLSHLVNLKKILMSYNLLQGPLIGSMFEPLQRLTHFEVESNYISGELPSELLELESIIYIYARRNSLKFKFEDIVQPNYLPNIFALWLDSNHISGSIPPRMDQWKDLASFSITNTTLGGELPTRMGNLKNMKRCWLYDNKLEGQIPNSLQNWEELEVLELYGNNLVGVMPQGICLTVKSSNYQYKTLSVDCEEVTCSEDCCTKCGK